MSKKTSYLLGIILTIIIGTILYYFLCCRLHHSAENNNSKTDNKTEVKPVIKQATKNAFLVKDPKGNFSLALNNNFNFKVANFSILEPVSTDLEQGVVRLKDYLIKNPSKTVDVVGLYKSNETNNSVYPNLGLARANSIKNYLVLHGVPSKQIDTYGRLDDSIEPDTQNTLFGPLKMNLITHDDPAKDVSDLEALKKVCQHIKDSPLTLHFKTGQAAISLTNDQRQKIADISHCVDKLEVKIKIVGHTDNTGNADKNLILGKQRAEFAKSYLVKNGILANTITTSSKGQMVPIADNKTAEGRAKNRRTVITIE
jgi:outer membrane protein OmpA-like peptidoglycan-associated protein